MALGELLTPALWYAVAVEWWHLTHAEASSVWAALAWSQAERPHRLWRWLMEQPAIDLALFRARWTPHELCYTFDELVREARLSQRIGSACQDAILAHTSAEGAWRPERERSLSR